MKSVVIATAVERLRQRGWTGPADVVDRVLAEVGETIGIADFVRSADPSLKAHMVRPAPRGFRRDLAPWVVA